MTTTRNILVFMGTRPEAVKLAPVVAALRDASDFRCTVVATGQHKEMFRQVADTFGFAVDADLDVMRPNQTLAGLTARLMDGIDGWLEIGQAGHGAGAGRHHHRARGFAGLLLPAHPDRPRRGRAAHRQHLVALPRGGEPPARHAAGGAALRADRGGSRGAAARGRRRRDHLGDRKHRHRRPAHRGGAPGRQTPRCAPASTRSLAACWAPTGRKCRWSSSPATAARTSATASSRFAGRSRRWPNGFPDHRFVYPVHLNPNVLAHVNRLLGELPNVRLIAPQGYRNFVALMARCRLVLTDSGGVQEEAPSLGKPVLVMRDTTERPEGVAAGTALLTGPKATAIVEHATRLLTDEAAYRSMATARNPYGDGHAAERIVERIRSYFAPASTAGHARRRCSQS